MNTINNKYFLKRNVFNDFLKVTNFSADLMSSGSGFHRAGAARLYHMYPYLAEFA